MSLPSTPATPEKGLCLLALDAGGPQAISQLGVLRNLLLRLANSVGDDTTPLPCSVFDVIGGVGSGGYIAILFVSLGLSVDQTEKDLIKLSRTVLEIKGIDANARTSLMRTHVDSLLREYGIDKDLRLLDPNELSKGCKLVVPLSRKYHIGSTCMLRNVEVPWEEALNITIAEALVATIATPPLFSPTSLFKDAATFEYIGADLNIVNPTREILSEAYGIFGPQAQVACLLSLGSGHPGVISVPHDSGSASWSSFLEKRVKDSETPAQVFAAQMGHLDLYQRFSVNGGLERTSLSAGVSMEVISAHTAIYLEDEAFSEKAEICAELLERRSGTATLEQLTRCGGEKVSRPPLPPLTDTFVMRNEPWEFMEEAIFGLRLRGRSDGRRMLLLTGIGGCGKTQIVRMFIQVYLERFASVFVIDGSSVSRIKEDIVRNVRALGTAYSQMSFKACMLFLAQSAAHGPRLIVYDNVDDPELELLPLLPGGDHCIVIVTSRNREVGNLSPWSHLELDVMSMEEATELLRLPTTRNSSLLCTREEALELANELGCLPIALTHARSYMFRTKCSASAYLDRLGADRDKLLASPVTYKQDMRYVSTWASLDASLELLSLREQRLLWLLSNMYRDKFPVELITLAAKHNFMEYEHMYLEGGDEYHTGVAVLKEIFHHNGKWSLINLDDMMASLENSSLVSRSPGFNTMLLQMHPLVHAWLQSRIPEEDRPRYKSASVLLLALGARAQNIPYARYLASHVMHMSPFWNELHVNDAGAFGYILNGAGMFRNALLLRDKVVLELRERHSPSISNALWALATTHRKLGQFTKAEIYQEEVLRLVAGTRGKCDPETIKAANDLANTYCDLGRPHHADVLQARVLGNLMDALGECHPDTLRAAHNLANIRRALGKLDDARNLQVETLRRMKAVQGDDHPDTIKASNSLATIYTELRRPLEAKILQLEALELMKETLGDCHPDTVATRNNLSVTYFALENYPKAQEIQEEVLRLSKQILGDHHPDTIMASKNLALTHRSLERLKEVRAVHEEMLRVIGEHHPDSNTVMINLADVNRKLGNNLQSVDLLRRAMASLSQTVGVNHPEYQRCNRLLSTSQATERAFQDVSPDFHRDSARTRAPGPSHRPTSFALKGTSASAPPQTGSLSERYWNAEKRSRADESDGNDITQASTDPHLMCSCSMWPFSAQLEKTQGMNNKHGSADTFPPHANLNRAASKYRTGTLYWIK